MHQAVVLRDLLRHEPGAVRGQPTGQARPRRRHCRVPQRLCETVRRARPHDCPPKDGGPLPVGRRERGGARYQARAAHVHGPHHRREPRPLHPPRNLPPGGGGSCGRGGGQPRGAANHGRCGAVGPCLVGRRRARGGALGARGERRSGGGGGGGQTRGRGGPSPVVAGRGTGPSAVRELGRHLRWPDPRPRHPRRLPRRLPRTLWGAGGAGADALQRLHDPCPLRGLLRPPRPRLGAAARVARAAHSGPHRMHVRASLRDPGLLD
mmetsp:Transcript_10515/g.31287  ORF Transcript_10515/g.31287 Transcript_10515/m.31287 type:complete len:265 (-) Transcript_10515:1689-2483(-)